MRIDPVVNITLSDLLVNLSAGWLIIAFGMPFSNTTLLNKLALLTANLIFGIVCLLSAIKLRKGLKP